MNSKVGNEFISENTVYYTYMPSKDGVITVLRDKFKPAREKLGLTQLQVAEKTGMDVTYYARIERGEINTSYDKLEKIAKALKIKLL